MMKKIIYITTIAMILLLGACSNEEILIDNDKDLANKPETAQTLSVTAIVQGDDPNTRVSLTQQDNRNIALKWEKDDVLHFAIVPIGEGTTPIQTSYTLKQDDISTDGKKANFNISLSGVSTEKFNLYGVYGGGGIDISGANPVAKLPANPGNAISLNDPTSSVESREDVMLYFKEIDIVKANPQISVAFQHLGSLFSVNLRNTCFQTFEGLTEVRLVGVDSNGDELTDQTGGDWAYNTGGQS